MLAWRRQTTVTPSCHTQINILCIGGAATDWYFSGWSRKLVRVKGCQYKVLYIYLRKRRTRMTRILVCFIHLSVLWKLLWSYKISAGKHCSYLLLLHNCKHTYICTYIWLYIILRSLVNLRSFPTLWLTSVKVFDKCSLTRPPVCQLQLLWAANVMKLSSVLMKAYRLNTYVAVKELLWGYRAYTI